MFSLTLPFFVSQTCLSSDPVPLEPAVEWLNNRAPRLISHRYRQYSPVPLDLVDFFNSKHPLSPGRYSHPKPSLQRWSSHLKYGTQRDNVRHAFLRVTCTAAPGSRLPDRPASPTPETLPHTALAPPPSVPAPCSAPCPSQSSQASSSRPQHLPPFFPSSELQTAPIARQRHLLRQPHWIYVPLLWLCSTYWISPSLLNVLVVAPTNPLSTKEKVQIKVTSKVKTNPSLIGHLWAEALPRASLKACRKDCPRAPTKASFGSAPAANLFPPGPP